MVFQRPLALKPLNLSPKLVKLFHYSTSTRKTKSKRPTGYEKRDQFSSQQVQQSKCEFLLIYLEVLSKVSWLDNQSISGEIVRSRINIRVDTFLELCLRRSEAILSWDLNFFPEGGSGIGFVFTWLRFTVANKKNLKYEVSPRFS